MTSFIYLLLFYCTFSQCAVFLCVHLVELIMPLLKKLDFKFQKMKRRYKKKNIIIFFIFALYFSWYLENPLYHILYVLLFGVVFTFIVLQFMDYSTVDINGCQRDNKSIGAFWAHHTYEFYYKKVFEDLNDRILVFEQKHKIEFTVKKLIIIVPFSCNVEGTLDVKDTFIEYFGDLSAKECDQGANVNRLYKNTVYKIHIPSKELIITDTKCVAIDNQYIVAEFPSPLATLWKTKEKFKDEIWLYHRNCFIKTLKYLTKNTPCIIVDYDDEKSSESLSRVLISTVVKEKEIPQILIS